MTLLSLNYVCFNNVTLGNHAIYYLRAIDTQQSLFYFLLQEEYQPTTLALGMFRHMRGWTSGPLAMITPMMW